jgi:hypothetical protein
MGFARVGSNPTVVDNLLRAIPLHTQFVLVAQWIAHQTSDLGVGGSSPPWDSLHFFLFRQIGRKTGLMPGRRASLAEWLRRWL